MLLIPGLPLCALSGFSSPLTTQPIPCIKFPLQYLEWLLLSLLASHTCMSTLELNWLHEQAVRAIVPPFLFHNGGHVLPTSNIAFHSILGLGWTCLPLLLKHSLPQPCCTQILAWKSFHFETASTCLWSLLSCTDFWPELHGSGSALLFLYAHSLRAVVMTSTISKLPRAMRVSGAPWTLSHFVLVMTLHLNNCQMCQISCCPPKVIFLIS